MHPVLTRGVRMALLGAATMTAEGSCQAPSPEVAAINAVMDWRLNWMGDPTPFNACTVYMAAGEWKDFPSGIRPGLIRGLDRTSAPCDGRTPERAGAWRPAVAVDSVVVQGERATVYVTVRKGELSYHETYSLVNPSPSGWGVSEVRTWGGLREYPVRPTPGASR